MTDRSMKHAIGLIALVMLVMLAGCGDPYEPTIDGGRQVAVFVDPATGCEYIGWYGYGLSPRLNPDGTQVCTEKEDGDE